MFAEKSLTITSETDVIQARMEVRETARQLGMQMGDQARISLATSSLANALGLGDGTMRGSIDINCLTNGKTKGLRVACTFRNNRDSAWVTELTRNVRWMLDAIDIRQLGGDYVEIAMTKWVH